MDKVGPKTQYVKYDKKINFFGRKLETFAEFVNKIKKTPNFIENGGTVLVG